MFNVLPSVLLATEILPGFVLDPEATAGFSATLCRLMTELGFSESSLLTEDSLSVTTAALDALRFYMLALTMFLKLTVIGLDFLVLIERRGFEVSC